MLWWARTPTLFAGAGLSAQQPVQLFLGSVEGRERLLRKLDFELQKVICSDNKMAERRQGTDQMDKKGLMELRP